MHEWKRTAVAVATFLISLAVLPGRVYAHGEPTPLELYGNYGSAARCQRAISRSARRCFEITTRLGFRCATGELVGRPCDSSRRDSLLDRAVQRSHTAVTSACTDVEAAVLGYTGLAEAVRDVTNTCTQEAVALTSLAYGPSMFTGEVVAGPPQRDACLRATSHYTLRLARAAVRQRARALDLMASSDMDLDEKLQVLDDAEAKIERVRAPAQEALDEICTPEEFNGSYGMPNEPFLDRLSRRADCVVESSHVQAAVQCPAPICGNAVVELGEQCDDGNRRGGDACDPTCEKTACDSFASTYDLIQAAVFDGKGCTEESCHGSSRSGGLDLRAPGSYDELVEHPASGSPLLRVARGDREHSFLYRKLAAGTLGTPVEGGPMPSGGLPGLTADELEAMRLWIYAGAPRAGVVENTASLLDACLPPADPIQIEPPPVPAAGVGVQLHMPPNQLPPESETEVCFASYFDFTDQVPAGSLDPSGTRFRYKKQTVIQDPLSHHLIIQPYTGEYGIDHPSWGEFACRGGTRAGAACDPTNPEACGEGLCGSTPVPAVGCIGYGPPDASTANLIEAFTGVQETAFSTSWVAGVYDEFPVKGIIIWNSHAFNLSRRPGKVEAWSTFELAAPEEQIFPVHRVTDISKIFVMNVPPYKEREYCHTYTFPQGAQLFHLSSHTHKRGKLFRIWDPQGALVYHNTEYSDPTQLTFDPPVLLGGDDEADRTYRYCAVYDNGSSDASEVKRRSTSPSAPPPFDFIRCRPTHCAEGKLGSPCSGGSDSERDRSCDSSPGASDGRCDACALAGGVTTDDEMFVLLAAYYLETE